MKSGNYFWGTFLVSLGLFFLLNNLEVANISIKKIWEFWPILLIVWGVSVLKIPAIFKNILSAISGLFLALVIVSLVNYNWENDCNWNINFNDNDAEKSMNMTENENDLQKLNYAYNPAMKVANFNLDVAAGNVEIGGNSDDLFLVSTSGAFADVDANTNDSVIDINFDFSSKISNNNSKSRFAKINLNPNITWNFDIDMSAAQCNLDLSQHKVGKLNIDAGAIDLDLKIGSIQDTLNVDISTGVSDFDLQVPINSACYINTDMALSEKNFNGFKKIKPGQFVSDNVGKTNKVVYINIEGGLSSINISRY